MIKSLQNLDCQTGSVFLHLLKHKHTTKKCNYLPISFTSVLWTETFWKDHFVYSRVNWHFFLPILCILHRIRKRKEMTADTYRCAFLLTDEIQRGQNVVGGTCSRTLDRPITPRRYAALAFWFIHNCWAKVGRAVPTPDKNKVSQPYSQFSLEVKRIMFTLGLDNVE